jgi:uncharacterized membrane protein YgdD (TMEM256/DUF423 family)
MINSRQALSIAAISGVAAVSLGAFGAHALKTLLAENGRLDTYELAVRYHFYHTLALLAIGILLDRKNSKYLSWSALFILAGMLFFSGSLYILALLNTTSVALITPLGGVFMIVGWGLLFYSVIKNR